MSKMRSRPLLQAGCKPLVNAAIALACALALSGCGAYIGRLPLIGEPKGTPPPPDVRPDSPSIGVKPTGADKAMTAAERQKMEAELNTARTQAADDRRKQIKQPPTQ